MPSHSADGPTPPLRTAMPRRLQSHCRHTACCCSDGDASGTNAASFLPLDPWGCSPTLEDKLGQEMWGQHGARAHCPPRLWGGSQKANNEKHQRCFPFMTILLGQRCHSCAFSEARATLGSESGSQKGSCRPAGPRPALLKAAAYSLHPATSRGVGQEASTLPQEHTSGHAQREPECHFVHYVNKGCLCHLQVPPIPD